MVQFQLFRVEIRLFHLNKKGGKFKLDNFKVPILIFLANFTLKTAKNKPNSNKNAFVVREKTFDNSSPLNDVFMSFDNRLHVLILFMILYSVHDQNIERLEFYSHLEFRSLWFQKIYHR